MSIKGIWNGLFSYPCPIPVHRDVRADAAAFPESVDGFWSITVTINQPASQQNEWCRSPTKTIGRRMPETQGYKGTLRFWS
jgi:hypothetical protein